ncbi:MAG: aminotransferase class V-fold PLP-dependent enzyme [Orrella sp.]
MTRHHNFCAGPAALPTVVLERARDEMLDYRGLGLSVMEMSHRSEAFVAIAEQAEADLRELLEIPDNYRVLFTQGGATLQFAAVPYNLLGAGGRANFVHTGIWGKKAIAEARHLFGDVHVAVAFAAGGHVNVAVPCGDETLTKSGRCHRFSSVANRRAKCLLTIKRGAMPKHRTPLALTNLLMHEQFVVRVQT